MTTRRPDQHGALDSGLHSVTATSVNLSVMGAVVEVDLNTQVLIIAADGVTVFVLDTSTGSKAGSTPIGQWEVEREIDGLRRSTLGLLYRPKYFFKGVAGHGYTDVPAVPASHGCVRVTYAAIDMIWDENRAPVGTPVWVY